MPCLWRSASPRDCGGGGQFAARATHSRRPSGITSLTRVAPARVPDRYAGGSGRANSPSWRCGLVGPGKSNRHLVGRRTRRRRRTRRMIQMSRRTRRGTIGRHAETAPGSRNEQAQIVIVDCDLSPSPTGKPECAAGCRCWIVPGWVETSRHARTRAPGCGWRSRGSIVSRHGCRKPAAANGGAGSRRWAGETGLELDGAESAIARKNFRANYGDRGRTSDAPRQAGTRLDGTRSCTNAGNSLMRAMTGSEVLVVDKLFATPIPRSGPLYPGRRVRKVFLSDTVGIHQNSRMTWWRRSSRR